MAKGTTHISLGEDMIALAKARGMNISAICRAVITAELDLRDEDPTMNDAELVNKLKGRLAVISSELNQVRRECEKKEVIIQDLKFKISQSNKENERRYIDTD